jgi:hypothetical protein
MAVEEGEVSEEAEVVMDGEIASMLPGFRAGCVNETTTMMNHIIMTVPRLRLEAGSPAEMS